MAPGVKDSMSPTSPRENMLAALSGRQPTERIVTPLVDRWAPLALGKRILHGDPVNDQLEVAERCGYDPLIVEYGFDWGAYLPSLKWDEEWEEAEDELRLIRTLSTPVGTVSTVIQEATGADWVTEFPVKRLEDYAVAEWMQDQFLAHIEEMRTAIEEQVKRARDLIGDRGLYYVTAGFGIGPSKIDSIYHAHDYPEVVARVSERAEPITRFIIRTAIESGVDVIFLADPPEGLKSVRRWTGENGPRLRETVDFIHECGGYALVHDCMPMREMVELGAYNPVKPDLLETLAPPPTGDIDDLRWARERIDPGIITKGNLDLGLLRDGTPAEIMLETHAIVEATAGYHHWVGAADAVLYGTPIENMQAMVEAAKTH